MATQFTELLKDANLKDKIKLCIVQTAYANGSSTHFIENVMVIIFFAFIRIFNLRLILVCSQFKLNFKD